MEKLRKLGPALLALSSIASGLAVVLSGDYAAGVALIVAGLQGLGVHVRSVQPQP